MLRRFVPGEGAAQCLLISRAPLTRLFCFHSLGGPEKSYPALFAQPSFTPSASVSAPSHLPSFTPAPLSPVLCPICTVLSRPPPASQFPLQSPLLDSIRLSLVHGGMGSTMGSSAPPVTPMGNSGGPPGGAPASNSPKIDGKARYWEKENWLFRINPQVVLPAAVRARILVPCSATLCGGRGRLASRVRSGSFLCIGSHAPRSLAAGVLQARALATPLRGVRGIPRKHQEVRRPSTDARPCALPVLYDEFLSRPSPDVAAVMCFYECTHLPQCSRTRRPTPHRPAVLGAKLTEHPLSAPRVSHHPSTVPSPQAQPAHADAAADPRPGAGALRGGERGPVPGVRGAAEPTRAVGVGGRGGHWGGARGPGGR